MSPRRALSESLDRLRSELARSSSLSEADRARLEALLGDVSAHTEEEREPEDESLSDRLREATEHLEEEHPKLTMAIGAVVEALSRLGI